MKFTQKGLESGDYAGYSVTTNLVATVNAEKNDDYYEVGYLPANKSETSFVVPDGIEAPYKMYFYSSSTNKAFAHETGHLMGNLDEYRFDDYNRDEKAQDGELLESDPGNIMGLFYKHDDPKARDKHLYKAMETSDKERAKREKKAKSNNQN